MSNRPNGHRPTMGRRYPYAPGVIPEHTPEIMDAAMAAADANLPRIPGCVHHVLVLTPDEGLMFLAERFGLEVAHEIGGSMRRTGSTAHPVLACRVPFTWNTERIMREAR